MQKLRYDPRKDWVFYLLVVGYAYLIISMTFRLWVGGGVNIFSTYSQATSPVEMLIDANKIYWSKTCFLFLTLLLFSLHFDYRFAIGVAATFWVMSLIIMFGPSPILIAVAIIGIALTIQQMRRKQLFSTSDS